MKKLMVAKLVFLLVLIVLCNFWYIKYFYTKSDNNKLEFEIEKAKAEIKSYNLSIENMETNVEKFKEEKKDRIEELETWKLMEEKIRKAL